MRFSTRGRRTVRITVIFLLILLIVTFAFCLVEYHIKPTLFTIAHAKVTLTATEIMNKVIREKVNTIVDPQTLVNVRLDNRGRVVMIQPNTMEFNKLAADTTIKIQEELRNIDEEKIKIPIGQILGSKMLASMGPKITITVIPVGTVDTKVIDKFEEAGINQTRHLVYLVATAKIRIVVPLISDSVSVSTHVPIAEYIVVGEVPNTYVQFPFPLPADPSINN